MTISSPLGSVFRSRGYDTAFIYGGYGYFDNMNTFFGGNGYRVVDRAAVKESDITFANAWGACDEDLYRWTLREADAAHASGQPFHYFVMTTSNHRPYTYPEGKIDLPPKISARSGAVKYTDYAIGEFLRAAADKPWFKNTVFVIVGDHCASVAARSSCRCRTTTSRSSSMRPGGQIASGRVPDLMSQIDYAPTLLGLLNWSYASRFYGRNVLSDEAEEDGPLFIGTYQKLGMYRRGALAVLQPVRKTDAYDYDAASHALTPCRGGGSLVADAIANYQAASWLFKNGVQREYVTTTTQP
jgi:phosphoglycerol transferase MdoB-like AlkP superfamily enzyme